MRHRMISIGDYAVENDRGDRGDLFEGGSGREMCRLRVQRDHTVLPMEAIWEKLTPHVNGAYANFLSSATEEDVAAVYPTEVYNRLAAVKRQYDPGNLFARNHNVRPH